MEHHPGSQSLGGLGRGEGPVVNAEKAQTPVEDRGPGSSLWMWGSTGLIPPCSRAGGALLTRGLEEFPVSLMLWHSHVAVFTSAENRTAWRLDRRQACLLEKKKKSPLSDQSVFLFLKSLSPPRIPITKLKVQGTQQGARLHISVQLLIRSD